MNTKLRKGFTEILSKPAQNEYSSNKANKHTTNKNGSANSYLLVQALSGQKLMIAERNVHSDEFCICVCVCGHAYVYYECVC